MAVATALIQAPTEDLVAEEVTLTEQHLQMTRQPEAALAQQVKVIMVVTECTEQLDQISQEAVVVVAELVHLAVTATTGLLAMVEQELKIVLLAQPHTMQAVVAEVVQDLEASDMAVLAEVVMAEVVPL
jgi:hypothetical protein